MIELPTYRLFFTRPRGFFSISRYMEDGVHYKDGFADTARPEIIEAAQADADGPQKDVTAVELISEGGALPEGKELRAQTKAPVGIVQCPKCRAIVGAEEYPLHVKNHGRIPHAPASPEATRAHRVGLTHGS